jgi:hypothetical protein
MELTYQQVLAEVYDDNARNVLVHQLEYDDEDKPPYEEHDYSDNELEDKEEFNKFHGDRNKPSHVIKPKPLPDGLGLASIKNDNIFRTSLLNIDGNFRASNVPTAGTPSVNCSGGVSENSLPINLVQSGSFFNFRPSRQYKNVYSVEVTSVEFPNNFYAFSKQRGNTTFNIIFPYSTVDTSANLSNTYVITIPDGNYINIINSASGTLLSPITGLLDQTTFLGAIQNQIDNIPQLFQGGIQIAYNATLHLIYFQQTGLSDNKFSVQFPSAETNSFRNGIGYNLGILEKGVVSSLQNQPGSSGLLRQIIVADTFPDVIQDNYVYLRLSDWNLVSHEGLNQTNFYAFMKIPLNTPKFTVQFDNTSSNSTLKKYFFHQPTNINLIVISILDAYGNVIDLKYSSFSITLQIQEVISTTTYEALLDRT